MLCRLTAAHKREKYESRHLGNFKRIYPSAAAPLQAKYERLLQGSARLFASSMKAKPHNTIGRIQVCPADVVLECVAALLTGNRKHVKLCDMSADLQCMESTCCWCL